MDLKDSDIEKMLENPDSRFDLIEHLDMLVTQAHDKYKEAMINMLGLKFSYNKYQVLGDLTFKTGCAGYVLETKSDNENHYEIVRNENKVVLHDHTVEKYFDSKGKEMSKTEYENIYDDEDDNEFQPQFDNIADFINYAKVKQELRNTTEREECVVEEKSEIIAREYTGGKDEIVHPNTLFNCTDISRPEAALIDVQRDWKSCLEHYISLTNFVNKVQLKCQN